MNNGENGKIYLHRLECYELKMVLNLHDTRPQLTEHYHIGTNIGPSIRTSEIRIQSFSLISLCNI